MNMAFWDIPMQMCWSMPLWMRFSALQHCGTIGRQFTGIEDPAYEGADSIELLKKSG